MQSTGFRHRVRGRLDPTLSSFEEIAIECTSDSIFRPPKSPVTPRFKPPIPSNYTHQEWLLRRIRPRYAGILFLAVGFGFSWPI